MSSIKKCCEDHKKAAKIKVALTRKKFSRSIGREALLL